MSQPIQVIKRSQPPICFDSTQTSPVTRAFHQLMPKLRNSTRKPNPDITPLPVAAPRSGSTGKPAELCDRSQSDVKSAPKRWPRPVRAAPVQTTLRPPTTNEHLDEERRPPASLPQGHAADAC